LGLLKIPVQNIREGRGFESSRCGGTGCPFRRSLAENLVHISQSGKDPLRAYRSISRRLLPLALTALKTQKSSISAVSNFPRLRMPMITLWGRLWG